MPLLSNGTFIPREAMQGKIETLTHYLEVADRLGKTGHEAAQQWRDKLAILREAQQ